MKEVYISLPTPERVQCFAQTIHPLEGDFELVSGGYILEARSLMGIFSFDLAHPILLRIYNATEPNLAALEPYIVDMEDESNGK